MGNRKKVNNDTQQEFLNRERLLSEIMQSDEESNLYELYDNSTVNPYCVYITFNINGDIIGVSDNRMRSIEIYEERYGHDYPDDVGDGLNDKFQYLQSFNKIKIFPVNYFIYA